MNNSAVLLAGETEGNITIVFSLFRHIFFKNPKLK